MVAVCLGGIGETWGFVGSSKAILCDTLMVGTQLCEFVKTYRTLQQRELTIFCEHYKNLLGGWRSQEGMQIMTRTSNCVTNGVGEMVLT